MSKNTNNVNPDHYKTAGREPQGQDVVHEVLRQQFGEAKAKEKGSESRGRAKNATKPRPNKAKVPK